MGMRSTLRLGLLLVVGVHFGGCRADECAEGVVRCVDNVAESCVVVIDTELTSHTELDQVACGTRFCQVPPPGSMGLAFCALDASPDPALPAALRKEGRISQCVDNDAVTWNFGFRVDLEVCASERSCVDASTPGFVAACGASAFCAHAQTPDMRCVPGVGTGCQSDTNIFYCACGFISDVHACESPGPSCVLESPAEMVAPQGVCR